MCWLWKLFCSVLFLYSCKAYFHSGIPPHLQDCYRHGGVPIFYPKRLDLWLAIIRKLESSSAKLNLNLKFFSSSLIRNLRLDGIEKYTTVENDFILPYRASAFQYQRFKLMMDFFLPSQELLNAQEFLSPQEKCYLHRTLSLTVRRWERGKERATCIQPVQKPLHRIPFISDSASKIHSQCPVEEGVVQTEWGTIAPGVLIATLVSALEEQRIQVSDILTTDMFLEGIPANLVESAQKEWMVSLDDVGNVMVASLAGDLAEVIVNQGPKVGAFASRLIIGTLQSWNDTLLPREHYLFTKNASLPHDIQWHYTDAEILAGIDGLIIADQLKEWLRTLKTLRLSQVLEMYYSDDGIYFDPVVKACNRKSLFAKVYDRQQLYADTVAFAHILSLHQLNHYVPIKVMQGLAEAAISAFTVYLGDVMARSHRVCEEFTTDSVLDLIVATDSSFDGYQVQQFMAWLSQGIHLDKDRNTLTLIHGTTGEFIIPTVDNSKALFHYFDVYTGSWPSRMSIPSVLTTVIEYSMNRTLYEIAHNVSAGPRTLILLISPVDHPTKLDINKGKTLMTSLRTSYFDVFFAYLSLDLSDFDLENVPKDEMFLSTTSSSLIDVIIAVDTALLRSVIPQKIIGTHCSIRHEIDFEQKMFIDTMPAFHAKHYRIHSFYLRETPVVEVHFRNHIQGPIRICTWRGDEGIRECENLIEGEKFDFKFINPCTLKATVLDIDCPPINFMVTSRTLRQFCPKDVCRLPNQIRFYLKHSGLKCLRLQASAESVNNKFLIYVIFLLKVIIYFCS